MRSNGQGGQQAQENKIKGATMIKTYAMDRCASRRKKAIVGAILLGLMISYMAIRTAERVGFARGYVYAMQTITD